MSEKELCGSTDTASGEPCKTPAHLCQWHDPDKPSPDGGRPTKLSYERQESIASEVEKGTPLVAACRLNDITHDTHRNWMRRGEEHYEDGIESPYRDYFGRLARALGYDQTKKTEVLWDRAVERGDTQTMLTILKQRYPDTWQDQDIGEAFGGLNVTSEVLEIAEEH